jgi:hypothetical protein
VLIGKNELNTHVSTEQIGKKELGTKCMTKKAYPVQEEVNRNPETPGRNLAQALGEMKFSRYSKYFCLNTTFPSLR